jgi:hypothetical protein
MSQSQTFNTCSTFYFPSRAFAFFARSHVLNKRRPSWPELDVDKWAGVLRLANLWSIDRARTAAIAALDKLVLSPSQRVQLARSFNVPGWQVAGLMELMQRSSPVNSADMDLIGVDTALKLAGLREKYGPGAIERSERLALELSEYDRFTRDLNVIRNGYEAVLDSVPRQFQGSALRPLGGGSSTMQYDVHLRTEAQKTVEASLTQTSRRRKELVNLRSSMADGRITPAIIRATFDLEEEDKG